MPSSTTTLQVRAMGASALPAVNLVGGLSDPYAVLAIARTKETHQTPVCLNTLAPTWYHTMVFHDVHVSDVLSVHLFDRNSVAPDTPLGSAHVSVAAALSHATAVASEAAYHAPPHPHHQPQPTPRSPNPQSHSPLHPSSSPSIPPSPGQYPAHYPAPSVYEPTAPPPSPPSEPAEPTTAMPSYPISSHPSHNTSLPNLSDDHDFTPEPPKLTQASAHLQRLMTMSYHIAPLGELMLIIAPYWLPDLEKGAPRKPYKKFQIHKLSEHVTHQSITSSIGKLLKTGAEKAGPLNTALHHLQPIQAVFQEHSTWKISLLGVDDVFRGKRHGWNKSYHNAQKIFQGPSSVVTRRIVQLQHAYLYGGGSQLRPVQSIRKELQEVTGNLIDAADFLRLLEYGIRRGKPRMFTYVIMPNRLYMAETGAKFFRDMLSKHAMHCSASPEVVYAGELQFRPALPGSQEPGFQLIVDNNSGTYAPGKEDLPLAVEVFRRNFPGLHVVGLDYESPLLEQYKRERPPSREDPVE